MGLGRMVITIYAKYLNAFEEVLLKLVLPEPGVGENGKPARLLPALGVVVHQVLLPGAGRAPEVVAHVVAEPEDIYYLKVERICLSIAARVGYQVCILHVDQEEHQPKWPLSPRPPAPQFSL